MLQLWLLLLVPKWLWLLLLIRLLLLHDREHRPKLLRVSLISLSQMLLLLLLLLVELPILLVEKF